MENKLIEFKGVSYLYDKKEAVSDVSFTVNRGDYLCILGENGTGKSTVVKLLVGLLKPESGMIEYFGINHTEIGYLPQSVQTSSDFPASVYEVVLQGRFEKLGKRFFYSSADKTAAEENMKLLSVDSLRNKSFASLSGGQKQRVLLARALCATGSVIVLDEPVSGLDPIATAEMYDVIRDLNRNKNITVIMVSHDTKTVSKYATKILHIKREVMFFGDTEEYEKTELYHEFLGGCGHEHH